MAEDPYLVILGEVKGKMDTMILIQAGLSKEQAEHGKRLNKLENSRAWLLGVGATISFIMFYGLKFIGLN